MMITRYKSLDRRSLLGAAALLVAGVAVLPPMPALAYSETSTKAINVDTAGVAIHGYDPVAYFTVGKPTPGNAQFTAKHEGATYRFASAANRDAFQKEPAKYAPAFGGFCAMGAALEKKLDGDPKLWRIVDGKLYLNVGEPAQKRWLEDVPGNIKKAESNWPKIKDKAPKDL
jgi:YHS domain-containing protein